MKDPGPNIILVLADDLGYGDLGDTSTGVQGKGCRPAGWVENARTLTSLDPDDPVVAAAYD